MTAVLGISAFYHDAAAALLVDGEIVAAAQEERCSRKKHDERFPTHAVDYCLREAGLDAAEIDYVGFYDKPLLKFDRLIETYLAYAPRGFRSFATGRDHRREDDRAVRSAVTTSMILLSKNQASDIF